MLFSSTSSRSSTRTPTPCPTNGSNDNALVSFLSRASRSKAVSVVTWALAILFTILAFSKLPTYCTGNSDFKGCMKCPENAKANLFSFVCEDNYVKVGDKCMIKDDELIGTSKKIKSIIGIKRIVSIDSVLAKLDNVTTESMSKSLEYLEDYEIVDSEIRKKNYGISLFSLYFVLSSMFYITIILFNTLKKKNNSIF